MQVSFHQLKRDANGHNVRSGLPRGGRGQIVPGPQGPRGLNTKYFKFLLLAMRRIVARSGDFLISSARTV